MKHAQRIANVLHWLLISVLTIIGIAGCTGCFLYAFLVVR